MREKTRQNVQVGTGMRRPVWADALGSKKTRRACSTAGPHNKSVWQKQLRSSETLKQE